VLLTVTGTVGGLCFAAWAGADKLWSLSRWGVGGRMRAAPDAASAPGRQQPAVPPGPLRGT
jgi:hypothetical protein